MEGFIFYMEGREKSINRIVLGIWYLVLGKVNPYTKYRVLST